MAKKYCKIQKCYSAEQFRLTEVEAERNLEENAEWVRLLREKLQKDGQKEEVQAK